MKECRECRPLRLLPGDDFLLLPSNPGIPIESRDSCKDALGQTGFPHALVDAFALAGGPDRSGGYSMVRCACRNHAPAGVRHTCLLR